LQQTQELWRAGLRTPVLMLNGGEDFIFPIESSQRPLFRLLGSPAADKRPELYDGGHVSRI
jgi:hypothetical protein